MGDNLLEYLEHQYVLQVAILNKLSNLWTAVGTISADPLFPLPQNISQAVNEIYGNINKILNSHLRAFSYLDKALMKGGRTILSNSVEIT